MKDYHILWSSAPFLCMEAPIQRVFLRGSGSSRGVNRLVSEFSLCQSLRSGFGGGVHKRSLLV